VIQCSKMHLIRYHWVTYPQLLTWVFWECHEYYDFFFSPSMMTLKGVISTLRCLKLNQRWRSVQLFIWRNQLNWKWTDTFIFTESEKMSFCQRLIMMSTVKSLKCSVLTSILSAQCDITEWFSTRMSWSLFKKSWNMWCCGTQEVENIQQSAIMIWRLSIDLQKLKRFCFKMWNFQKMFRFSDLTRILKKWVRSFLKISEQYWRKTILESLHWSYW